MTKPSGLYTVIFALCICSSPGRVVGAEYVQGQVLDYDTGQPVAGAIVVARWLGVRLGSGRSVCVNVQTAVSSSGGEYKVPKFGYPPLGMLSTSMTVEAYHSGYEAMGRPLDFYKNRNGTWSVVNAARPQEPPATFGSEESARAATFPANAYLRRATINDEGRFEYLRWRVFSGLNCFGGEGSRRNLYELQRAAYLEAKPLAHTREQRESLNQMREIAKSNWLALPDDAVADEEPQLPESVKRDLE